MDFEYVALTWTGHLSTDDKGFCATYHRWYLDGWREVRRASYPAANYGGACIIRRPKDEPEGKREPEPTYEYVAVLDEDEARGQWDALKRRGWVQARCVRLSGRRVHIHLMRRIDPTVVIADVESKDESRIWTEAELERKLREQKETIRLLTAKIGRLQIANDALIRDLGWALDSREEKAKGEPRIWTEAELRGLAQHIAGTLTLWQLHASQWTETQLVDTILGAIREVLIVPASESPVCSEPRMWTEAEIQEIARKVLTTFVSLSAM